MSATTWSRTCATTGKRCYHSSGGAKDASRAMGNRIRVYVCPDCHSWHVTHEQMLPEFKSVRRAAAA